MIGLAHDAILDHAHAVEAERPGDGGLQVEVTTRNEGAAIVYGRVHDRTVVDDLDLWVPKGSVLCATPMDSSVTMVPSEHPDPMRPSPMP